MKALAAVILAALVGIPVVAVAANRLGTIVKGTVGVGPTCPLPPCPPIDLSPYTLAFTDQQGRVSTVRLASDGSYSIRVHAGVYSVSMPVCPWLGCREFPLSVTAVGGQTTTFDISIDTGIR